MSYKDLYTYTQPFQTLAPAARTNGDVDGAGIDRKFNESAIIILDVGLSTDGTQTFTVEESDDNVVFTPVAAADLQGAFPVISSANDNATYHVGYIGSKRYLRVNVVTAGATTGTVSGVVIVQDYPRYAGSSQLEPYNKSFD